MKKRTLKQTFIPLLVILVAVLVTVSFSALEKKFSLKKDFSFTQASSYSSKTEEALKNLPYKVEGFLLSTPESRNEELITLLERYEAGGEMFTCSRDSLLSNPLLVHSLSSSLEDGAVTAESLILYCRETGRTRVLNPDDFITLTYDEVSGAYLANALNYEEKITEALLYVTSDSLPSVALLSGHGEFSPDEAQALIRRLIGFGYQVNERNLARGDDLSSDRVLMILSPQIDISESELGKIQAFLSSGGSLFVTSDYADPNVLTNLDALLRTFGIERKAGLVVAEEKAVGSFYDSPLYLMPYMQQSEATTPLIVAGQDRVMLLGSRALQLNAQSRDIMLFSLLKTDKAYLRPFEPQDPVIQKQAGDEEGIFDLAALCDRADSRGNHAKCFVIGSSTPFLDDWMYENTYAGAFLQSVMATLTGVQQQSLGIAPKMAVRPLMSWSSPVGPLALIALPVVLVLAAGGLVLYKRRRL